MAGDRARVSYDPSRKWRGLVAQQGRVTVDADWNEAAAIGDERDRLATLDVVGPVGTPDAGYAVTAVPATGPAPATPGDLTIGPGTLYLGGERLDLDAPVTYSTQPDWLDHSTDPLWVPPAVPAAAGASHELVYLLAPEHEVSATEDPALADVALGGPDTMQRQRILQRFVRQPSQSGTCADAWGAFVSSLGGEGLQYDAASMMIEPATTLQVSFTNTPDAPDPCQPVAVGGFQGAENQMIRVMVTSVEAGVPTIVWGFDDASFLYRLQAATFDSASDRTTVTLASAPVDTFHNPGTGQAVELLRDAVKLTAADYIAAPAGVVLPLFSAYDPTRMQLVISGHPPADYLSAATPQLYLRVWQSTVAAPPGEATPLGDTGVAVTLASSTGTFHAGDFWRFALRPIQPAIVYPARFLAEPQPPDGPRTFACPLAVLTWEDGNVTSSNCVPPFEDLVKLTTKGSCCTVDVGPSHVGGGASLQALINSYASQGPVTVCLDPGTYTLPAPLMIGPGLDGITLQGCREGVIFQAPSEPAADFVLGLIAMTGVNSVTIRGIELSVPLAGFSPPSGAFDDLPAANLNLLSTFSEGLQTAIGISVDTAAGLTVEGCTFDFPDPGQANVFGAGIFAMGNMDGVEVTGCTFQSTSPPETVPFYDLAAGNVAPPPYQATFGYLQVPTVAPGRSGKPGDTAPGAATVQLLHDATIGHCLFRGMTVSVLAMAQLGTLRINQNTVRNSYGGFWLVSLADPSQVAMFDETAVGNPDAYQSFARSGIAALADRLFVIAPAIGQVLPPAAPPAVTQVTDTGTGVSLQLDFYGCQVDAVIANSFSGAGLLVMDLAQTGSALVHGSRIRNRFSIGEAVLTSGVAQLSVTGNTVSNEAPPLPQGSPDSHSMTAVPPDTAPGTPAMAITGNVFIGPTHLPARPSTIPDVIANWDVLNTVITSAPPPIVTGISPASGPGAGGNIVTITGSGFTGATAVQFGTISVPPLPGGSDSQITAPSPAGGGTVDVTVTTPAGTSPATAADQFTYGPVVTGVQPNHGPARGLIPVIITGSGFTGATAVHFGPLGAAVSVNSDSQITTFSPPGAAVAPFVDVRVTTPAGISPITGADHFTWVLFGQPSPAVEEQAPATPEEQAPPGRPARPSGARPRRSSASKPRRAPATPQEPASIPEEQAPATPEEQPPASKPRRSSTRRKDTS
jgi:hypothetical protein